MSGFQVGDKVKLRPGVLGWGDASSNIEYRVVDVPQAWNMVRDKGEIPYRTVKGWGEDFILVSASKKARAKKTPAPPAPIKAKHIYSVVYKNRLSDPVTITMDRTLAREIKAELGGKAAGVEILKYKAAKEIR